MLDRLRKMPVADAALVLSIAFMAYLLPLIFVSILLKDVFEFQTVFALVAGIWLVTLGFFIWKSGRVGESKSRVLDLRIFHALPLLILIISVPHFFNWDEISYMMGFVELLILGALAIYGMICFRILILPPWPYWCYLSMSLISTWILFAKL